MTDRPDIADDGLSTIEHDGEEIHAVDFSNCNEAAVARRAAVAAAVIRKAPEDSILTFANLRGCTLNMETISIFRDYATKNRPYILAAAVVGLDDLNKIMSSFNGLTGRGIRAFDDPASAMAFLVNEKRRRENESAPLEPEFSIETGGAVRWVEYDGERVLVMNYGECDVAELRRRIKLAMSVIRREPPRSVVALNIVNEFPFDRDVNREVIEFVKGNGPYVVAAAAIGFGYMKSAIPVLNRFTGRNIRAFDEAEPAIKWLVSEKRRLSNT